MKTKNLDLFGLSAAGLCLIHCLVFPLLMIVPFGIAHNVYIDLFFFLVGMFVVYRITRYMKITWLKYLFWTSILMIGVSVLLDLTYHMHLPLMYIGVITLVLAHIINFKNHSH